MLTIKNRLAGFFALIFLAIGVATVATGCRPPGASALLAGKKFLEQGKTDAAIEKLKTATSLLATNADAWNYLALAEHSAGQADAAALAYQKALALNPNLVEAHYNFGCLLLEQNHPGAARAELTTFTLSRPKDINGWLKLGAAQMSVRDWNNAERSFTEALNLNRQLPQAWNGLGLIQVQRNRFRDAATDFDAALKCQSDYAPALLNLAVVQHQYLGNLAAALEKYQAYAALKSAPDKEAVVALARALEAGLNPATAAKIAAAPATPAVKPAVTNLPPAAPRPVVPVNATPAPNLAAPVAVAPPKTNPPPPKTMVTANPGPPQKFWPEVTPLPPPSTPPVDTAKLSNEAPVKVKLAVRAPAPKPKVVLRYTYHSTTKSTPGNRAAADIAFAQGLNAQENHRLNDALAAFEAATKADPGYFNAYNNLAWTAYELKDWPTALSAYETAVALDPESPYARYSFALTLKQAGYPLDAVYELKKLLARKPNDAAAHLLVANLYSQQLGSPQMARPHYLKVLEIEPQHPQATQIRYWLAGNPP